MVKIDRRVVDVSLKEVFGHFILLENQDIANDTSTSRVKDNRHEEQDSVSNSVDNSEAALNRIPKYRLKFAHSDSNVRKHPIEK